MATKSSISAMASRFFTWMMPNPMLKAGLASAPQKATLRSDTFVSIGSSAQIPRRVNNAVFSRRNHRTKGVTMKAMVSLTVVALLVAPAQGQQLTPAAVQLHWLDGASPSISQGVSWGVPWPRGAMKRETTFNLSDSKGNQVPVQTWPLAYWPDGSLKWSGHAISAGGKTAGSLILKAGMAELPPTPLEVRQIEDSIEISNGKAVWRIAKKGECLVDSVAIGKQVIAAQGRLIGMLEDRSEFKGKRTIREEDFVSQIDSAKLEQSGPVRAVVKIEGKHRVASSGRMWLPFTVRLYFFAGADSVKMVHTFVFDGDQEKDFIRGLGVRFTVPMRQQVHNRHVRLEGETGMFAEPVQVIEG